MTMKQTPQCPKSPLHDVYRLPKLPAQILRIANGQGPPTTRILEPEAPPWWCDRCGLPVAGAAAS